MLPNVLFKRTNLEKCLLLPWMNHLYASDQRESGFLCDIGSSVMVNTFHSIIIAVEEGGQAQFKTHFLNNWRWASILRIIAKGKMNCKGNYQMMVIKHTSDMNCWVIKNRIIQGFISLHWGKEDVQSLVFSQLKGKNANCIFFSLLENQNF